MGAFMAFASLPLLFLSFPSAPPPLPPPPSPSHQQEEFLYLKISKWKKKRLTKKCMSVVKSVKYIIKQQLLLSVLLTHKQVFIEKTKISNWQQVFTF